MGMHLQHKQLGWSSTELDIKPFFKQYQGHYLPAMKAAVYSRMSLSSSGAEVNISGCAFEGTS